MATASEPMGHVASLWRYPVKSMQGEELNATSISERGLLGDRAFALVDSATGKVASAKNPRKWPNLFDFRAAYVEPPVAGQALPKVRITIADGSIVTTGAPGMDDALTKAVGRSVSLRSAAPDAPVLEEYWPDVEGLEHREKVTDENMPKGLFFDLGTVHVLTTATLDRLRELYPAGRFEVRRFRPNVVVVPSGLAPAFVENNWVGKTLCLGNEVRLRVTKPCGRCVMTTLTQADLPSDLGILKTAVKHNGGNVGVYATVERGGIVRRKDPVRVE